MSNLGGGGGADRGGAGGDAAGTAVFVEVVGVGILAMMETVEGVLGVGVLGMGVSVELAGSTPPLLQEYTSFLCKSPFMNTQKFLDSDR